MTTAVPFSFDLVFLLFAMAIAVAYTTEAAIGFGGMLIAVTLGANLYPISEILPVLVCLSVSLTSYIVLRHRRFVAWRVLLRRILPAMGLGLALGFRFFADAPDDDLETFLGVFVVLVAGLELRRVVRASSASQMNTGAAVGAISDLRFGLVAFAAGVVQGITATGGPILVYGVGRIGLSKGEFRSTLAAVWGVMNGSLLLAYAANGRLGAHNITYAAALVPVLVGAVFLGEWAHGRLDEATFRKVVLSVLVVAGLLLLLV